MRAFGHEPCNFEAWLSDVTIPELTPPLLTITPQQREDVSDLDRFNMHRAPTRRVFSGTGLDLVTRPATIRYFDHSATAVLSWREDSFLRKSRHPPEESPSCHFKIIKTFKTIK
ncbi:uncharacterized protein TNCV_743151 [Trichonephila clavipes]|nr:uncharacterized protein TNCV_743151 [Trichonephila clavipes]